MPYLWHTSAEEVGGMTVALMFLPSVAAVGVGVPLWFSAEWFAARIFPSGGPQAQGPLRGDAVFALGASIIGLLLVCEGVPAISSAVYLFGKSLESGVLGPDEARQRLLWDASAKASTLGGTRLVVGAALLAGPARLSSMFARVRKEFAGSLLDEDEPHQR